MAWSENCLFLFMATRARQRIDCRQCSHFHITWDERFPYGCRAMGFKSKVAPCLDVFAATRQPCLSFTPKEPRDKRSASIARDDISTR